MSATEARAVSPALHEDFTEQEVKDAASVCVIAIIENRTNKNNKTTLPFNMI